MDTDRGQTNYGHEFYTHCKVVVGIKKRKVQLKFFSTSLATKVSHSVLSEE